MIEAILIRVGLVVAIFLGGVGYGYIQFNESAKIMRLQGEIVTLRINTVVMAADDAQAYEDRQKLIALDKRIKDLRNELSEKDRVCFEPADTNRLRKLWGTK